LLLSKIRSGIPQLVGTLPENGVEGNAPADVYPYAAIHSTAGVSRTISKKGLGAVAGIGEIHPQCGSPG